MKSGNLRAATPRNGDWGPAYALQGPTSDIGLLTLRPGDEMANHYHQHCDETFIIISGSVTLWVDCEQRFELGSADVFRCEPGEMHYLVNETAELLELVFIKSPQSPGDTVTRDWHPGDPRPTTTNQD